MSAKAKRRMWNKEPRAAHCLGCGITFDKMHIMINHRRNERCGGRFLPLDERVLYDKAKVYFEAMLAAEKEGNQDAYRVYFHNRGDCLSRAYVLRKLRLDAKEQGDVAA